MCSFPKLNGQVFRVSNRRGGDRVALQSTVTYSVEGREAAQARTLNVSQSGARLILQGGKIHFRNRVTVKLGTHKLQARVVWEESFGAGNCRVVGVQFEGMSAAENQGLKDWIRTQRAAA